MLDALRTEVLEANLELQRRGLVLFTFGNASGIDRERGLVVIKPSGVPYEKLKAEDLVIVGLDGTRVEGDLNPSSDLPTHILPVSYTHLDVYKRQGYGRVAAIKPQNTRRPQVYGVDRTWLAERFARQEVPELSDGFLARRYCDSRQWSGWGNRLRT